MTAGAGGRGAVVVPVIVGSTPVKVTNSTMYGVAFAPSPDTTASPTTVSDSSAASTSGAVAGYAIGAMVSPSTVRVNSVVVGSISTDCVSGVAGVGVTVTPGATNGTSGVYSAVMVRSGVERHRTSCTVHGSTSVPVPSTSTASMFTSSSSAVSMSSAVAGRSMASVVSPPKESVNDPSVAVETMSCVDWAEPRVERLAGDETHRRHLDRVAGAVENGLAGHRVELTLEDAAHRLRGTPAELAGDEPRVAGEVERRVVLRRRNGGGHRYATRTGTDVLERHPTGHRADPSGVAFVPSSWASCTRSNDQKPAAKCGYRWQWKIESPTVPTRAPAP